MLRRSFVVFPDDTTVDLVWWEILLMLKASMRLPAHAFIAWPHQLTIVRVNSFWSASLSGPLCGYAIVYLCLLLVGALYDH